MDREDLRDIIEGIIGFGSLMVVTFMLFVIGG